MKIDVEQTVCERMKERFNRYGMWHPSKLEMLRLLRNRLVCHRWLSRRVQLEATHRTDHIGSEVWPIPLQLEYADVLVRFLRLSWIVCLRHFFRHNRPLGSRYRLSLTLLSDL